MQRAELLIILNNIALLLVIAAANEAINLLPRKLRRLRPWFNGIALSLICIAIMNLPLVLRPGLIYDTRWILLSVSGLVYGSIPTLIAAAAAIVYRLIIGGVGMPLGIASIVSSAAIGLIWRRWVFPKTQKWRWGSAFLMGLAVHAVVIVMTFLLPYSDNIEIFKKIAFPILVLFPIGSILLCMLLIRQQDYKLVQNQLRESEERFKSLFEKAPLGYQSLDYNGNFLEVNQQWLNMLGYTRDEVIGKWFGDFVVPEHRNAFRERFPLFKSQGHIHSEFKMLHKNGTPVFIAFDGKIGYSLDGSFLQTHCILQNVTFERQMEENLRISEEKYRRLFETMALGVVYQSSDGYIVSLNPAAERILGRSLDEVRGTTSMSQTWKTLHEDGTEATGKDHPAMIALKTGKPFGPRVLGIYNPKLDDYVWISINAIPLFQPGDSVPYQVYTTFQDVTAEHKANRNYYLLFHEMVDAYALHEIICDEAGKPVDYRFLAVNSAFEQMTGLKAEDIIGKTVLAVLPGTEPYWIETYGRVALTGEPARFESYTITSDKYFAVSAYQPAPKQFACTFSDVTQRVAAERALQENEEKYRLLYTSMSQGLALHEIITDENGKPIDYVFLDINESYTQLLGVTREMCIGKRITQVMPKVEPYWIDVFGKVALSGEPMYYENYLETTGRFYATYSYSPKARQFAVLVTDITEKKTYEENLEYLSYHDQMTDLFNRRYYEMDLKRLNSKQYLPLSIIMGDINGVKLVNDAFGHAYGDQLIIDSANILRGCCREGDTLARIGGDEFAILMPNTDGATALKVINNIQETLKAYDRAEKNDRFRHSISLGFGTKKMPDEDIAQIVKIAEEYMYQRKLLEHNNSHSAIVASIKATMFEKSHETEEHGERLVVLSRMVASGLNLSQGDKDRLELLATLHDIGKVAINDQILTKRGKLTDEEWVEMKRHPEIGYRIAMSSPDLISVAEGILCHQERWDGTGYPQALQGENIPLLARIIAVVDAYDAMTQDRPYRKAMSHEAAVAEIEKNAGTQFDPAIARVFVQKCMDDLDGVITAGN